MKVFRSTSKALQSKSCRPVVYIKVLFAVPRDIITFLFWLLFSVTKFGVFACVYIGILAAMVLYPRYMEYSEYANRVVSEVGDFKICESSRVYDANGDLIAVLRDGAYQKYLEYDEIPEDVVNAFVAIEDRTFWENDGVDYKGIIRVMFRAVMSGGSEIHGASTITQQLVRNNFLSREVKLERKIKEILISRRLTEKLTKEQIMEYYVNNIGYGNGIEGIAGAAWGYFGKDVKDLSLSQIAYLCAIPNSPSYYNPYGNFENAIPRRDKILEDMFECGYISEDRLEQAKSESIVIEKGKLPFNNYETTYAVDCAIRYLMKLDGFDFRYSFEDNESYEEYHRMYNETYEVYRSKLYNGGYLIYTSLDTKKCAELQEVLDNELLIDDEVNDEGIYAFQGALTAIDNATGKVIALVGGRSQDSNNMYSFNRAYQGYRQPGSTIKPLIVYAPAFWDHVYPDSILKNIDAKLAMQPGASITALEGDEVDLRTAVEKSMNGAAMYMFCKVGIKNGMRCLVDMEYANLHPDDWRLSSALGGFTKGVTSVEQASAFRTLVNRGYFKSPTCLVSLLDDEGVELFEDFEEKSIYAETSADTMIDILKGVLTCGTGSKLNWYSYTDEEAWGKTGTTNDNKDGWFCGSTQAYTIAVWVGYDIPRETEKLQGATYPGEIWRDSMLRLLGVQ